MRPMRLVWAVLHTILLAVPALAEKYSGQVVGVIDGDTIDVLHNEQAEHIRLNGIDCPKKRQAFGRKAKQFTSTLVYGKEVTVHVLRKDRHGRTVGDVVLLDGTNVSRELIMQRKPASFTRSTAIMEGMKTMFQGGLAMAFR